MDKEAAKKAAEYAKAKAQESLESAVVWTKRGGVSAGHVDLVTAGALFAAAAELDKQAK